MNVDKSSDNSEKYKLFKTIGIEKLSIYKTIYLFCNSYFQILFKQFVTAYQQFVISMKKRTIEELHRLDNASYQEVKKLPYVIVLDHVRSLNNVGSVFRTSDAFLVEKIVLCGITATPPNQEIHKTALGAEDSVKWEYYEKTEEALFQLRNEGYQLLAIEQVENSTMLQDLVLDKHQKYAVILGNEVKGVQQSVVDMCDQCIELPQFGTKHSLNVSVTAGIVIWDFFNKLID